MESRGKRKISRAGQLRTTGYLLALKLSPLQNVHCQQLDVCVHNLISNRHINQAAVKPFLITRPCIKKPRIRRIVLGEKLGFEYENSHEINCVAYGKVFAVAAESCLIKNLHTHTHTCTHTHTQCVSGQKKKKQLAGKLEPQGKYQFGREQSFVLRQQRKSNEINYIGKEPVGHLEINFWATCPHGQKEISCLGRQLPQDANRAQLMAQLNCYVLPDNCQRTFLLFFPSSFVLIC